MTRDSRNELALRRELAARVALSRRQLLTRGAALGGLAALGAVGCASSTKDASGNGSTNGSSTTAKATVTAPKIPDGPKLASSPFQSGIASGDPTPSAVILWTRLVIDPVALDGMGGIPKGDYPVAWEVATDEKMTELVAAGVETATAEFGYSIHADATGLEPDTWYFYRFRTAEHTSPVGSTRTLPTKDASVDKLAFAFVSCQEYQNGYYTAHAAIAQDRLDMVFHLGDYIYEYGGGDKLPGRKFPWNTFPRSLGDYRRQYSGYNSDKNLQAARAHCPWVVTWDDHEVENNYAALLPSNADRAAEFPNQRAAAYQAYWENQPLRIDSPDENGELALYRNFRFGSLAEFFVLDGRQFRSDQPCDDKIAVAKASCPEVADPKATMLGSAQEAWLTQGLTESTTTWKALAQQTVMTKLELAGLVLNLDQWDGYAAARDRLLSTLADKGIENTVVLTGDIHSAGAANLHDPKDSKKIVAHEFVGTSITSETLIGAVPTLADIIKPETFGLEYFNIKDHGYGRCTVTPTKWTTEYVMVETVEKETSPTRVDGTLEITAGTPGMKKV